MKKIFFSITLLLAVFSVLISPASSYADSTQMHILGFTYSSGGSISRIFLSPIPDGVVSPNECVLYDSNHTLINTGSVMTPINGCSLNATIPDGQYTVEVLDSVGHLDSPLGVSDPFYMIDGIPSIQPPASPTPIPDNLPPQIFEPQYVVLNTNDIYYLQDSFIDEDSTSWIATVDYGDGSGQQPLSLSGRNFVLQHQYTTDGTFVVTINITDEHGNRGTMTGIVAAVPTPPPAPSLTISNINYFYTSPSLTTLTISFTPNTSFSTFGCDLLINGTDEISSFSRTANSCSFHPNFGFDYNNLSLLLYADKQRTQTQRTNSVFYTTTQLLSVTGLQFNQNALLVNTNISKINEQCNLLDQNNNVIAQTNLTIGNGNSCIFSGFGTNGPNHVPDGTYKLELSNAGLTSNVFIITNPIPPQIAPLSGGTIILGDTYSENGSFTDSDSSSWTATVDYGEGAGAQPLTINADNTFSLSHQYATAGTYTVTVTITDNQGITGTATATVIVNNPAPTALTPIADTYIRSNSKGQNEGSSPILSMQDTGNTRSLIQFDESQIQAAVGSSSNYTATLQFTIAATGNNGSTGRQVDVDRVIQNWAEGNGYIASNSTPNRGTGSGADWYCAIDTNITNDRADCSGSGAWDMTDAGSLPFITTPTATTTVVKNQTGTVSFDVTSDVQSFLNGTNPNDGWLVKLDNESVSGKVQFGSRESSTPPQLIITKN